MNYTTPDGRVLIMEVPAAPRRIPIAWKGHYYARSGESLVPMSLGNQDEIQGLQLAAQDAGQRSDT